MTFCFVFVLQGVVRRSDPKLFRNRVGGVSSSIVPEIQISPQTENPFPVHGNVYRTRSQSPSPPALDPRRMSQAWASEFKPRASSHSPRRRPDIDGSGNVFKPPSHRGNSRISVPQGVSPPPVQFHRRSSDAIQKNLLEVPKSRKSIAICSFNVVHSEKKMFSSNQDLSRSFPESEMKMLQVVTHNMIRSKSVCGTNGLQIQSQEDRKNKNQNKLIRSLRSFITALGLSPRASSHISSSSSSSSCDFDILSSSPYCSSVLHSPIIPEPQISPSRSSSYISPDSPTEY